MVVLYLLIILLVIEPTVIDGRAYSCYVPIPCALTKPCSEPNWNCDPPANSPSYACGNNPEPPNPPSCSATCYRCPLCCQVFCPSKKKKKTDIDTNNLLSSILQIPGLLADSILNGQSA